MAEFNIWQTANDYDMEYDEVIRIVGISKDSKSFYENLEAFIANRSKG